MRVRLKLSISHDMDLITLAQCQFPIAEWIKISLKSYVEEKRLISIPLPEMPPKIRYEKCEINFSLNDVRDLPVIEWLKNLRVGQRSGAIKSVFRCSLSAPCLAGHAADASAVIKAEPKAFPSAFPSIPSNVSSTVSREKPMKKAVTPAAEKILSPESESDDFDIFAFNPDR